MLVARLQWVRVISLFFRHRRVEVLLTTPMALVTYRRSAAVTSMTPGAIGILILLRVMIGGTVTIPTERDIPFDSSHLTNRS